MNIFNEFDIYNADTGSLNNINGEDLMHYSEYLYNEMMEFCKDDSDIMTEGVVLSSMKKGLKNFWELLKKFFSYIINFFKWLFNKIFKKKQKQTADQIADHVGVKRKKKRHIKEYDLINTDNDHIFLEAENSNAKDIAYQIENFPAAPGSVIKPTHIKFIVSMLRIEIQTKGTYIIGLPYGFEGKAVEQYANSIDHIATRPGVTSNSELKIRAALMYIGKEYDKFDLMNNLISKITSNPDKLNNDEYCSSLRSDMNKISSIDKPVKDIHVTHSDIMGKYGLVNNLANNLRATVKETDTCMAFNTLAKEIMNYLGMITMGLNAISAKINCMHLIDASYLHSISDIETLGKFVNEMIKQGFDTKDVAYNTWCIMDKSYEERSFFYKWDDINTPEEAPRWGQSRVVFFPKNKKNILKCATNGMGLVANDTELNRYKLYKKYDLAKYLCEPFDSYYNNTIIEFEKLKPITANERDSSDVYHIEDRLYDAYLEHNLPRIGDLHKNNFGKTDKGEYKVLDYAG